MLLLLWILLIPLKQLHFWQYFPNLALTMNTSQQNITSYWWERWRLCIEILSFQQPIFRGYVDGWPLQLLYIHTLREINLNKHNGKFVIMVWRGSRKSQYYETEQMESRTNWIKFLKTTQDKNIFHLRAQTNKLVILYNITVNYCIHQNSEKPSHKWMKEKLNLKKKKSFWKLKYSFNNEN